MTNRENPEQYLQLMDRSSKELAEMGVADDTCRRLQRLRAAYAYWLDNPRDSQSQMVYWLCHNHSVAKSQAYRDLALLRSMMGRLQQLSKDFARWRFDQMIDQAFDKAVELEDPKAMTAAASSFAKFHKLDQEDEKGLDLTAMMPQSMSLTENPRSANVKPIPNLMKTIGKLTKRYADADIEMVQAEMEDMLNLQDIPLIEEVAPEP
ncbi:MAG: hypothetical protein IJ243_09070 [Prevotella sp.]|nr:hypothetical protein [Prevotella sp.]